MRPKPPILILALVLFAFLPDWSHGQAYEAPAERQSPLGIVLAFYDAMDASRLDDAAALFAEDALLSTWAEGINGRHWKERRFQGKDEIRGAFDVPGLRGLRRQPVSTDGAYYKDSEDKVSEDEVFFMLRPDRRSPDGRQYDPFIVRVTVSGGKIKKLTVVEFLAYL